MKEAKSRPATWCECSTHVKKETAEFHCIAEGVSSIEDFVQCEETLTICVDGCVVCTLSCSADHLEELTVGHLLTQGVISSRADIEKITLEKAASAVYVRLTDAARARAASEESTVFITTSSARLTSIPTHKAEPFGATVWNESLIYSLAADFAKDKTSHARTRGCHSAYLANSSGILCLREDIGRHNAFDKAVGWAALNNVDLRQCLLFTSGRVPTDMVMKAIRARIPVLVSKSVTTDKAIELARSMNLVLLCEAKPQTFELLSGPGPLPEALLDRVI